MQPGFQPWQHGTLKITAPLAWFALEKVPSDGPWKASSQQDSGHPATSPGYLYRTEDMRSNSVFLCKCFGNLFQFYVISINVRPKENVGTCLLPEL